MSCVDSTVSPSIRTVPSAVSRTTDTSSPSGWSLRSHGASTTRAGIELAVAGEHVTLVERRLPVGPWRVRDVSERAAAGKQRRLPAVTPEALELADPLTPDAQAAAGERAPVAADRAERRGPGTAVRTVDRPSGRPRLTSAALATARRAHPGPTAARPAWPRRRTRRRPAARPSRPRPGRPTTSALAWPSKVIRHVSNAATHSKASGPAPSTVGRPSGPAAGRLGASAGSGTRGRPGTRR